MSAANHPADRPELPDARRLAREAAKIDAALESVAAGRIVSEEAVDAWIDSLGTANENPSPRSGR